jgi:hypothetical protein
MSRYRGRLQKFFPGFSRLLLGATVVLVVSACGKHPDMPGPAQSPPRPIAWSGHVFTAQMDLPVRPVPVSPGEM